MPNDSVKHALLNHWGIVAKTRIKRLNHRKTIGFLSTNRYFINDPRVVYGPTSSGPNPKI